MNIDVADNKKAATPAGWIYFDGECRFCAAHRECWGSVFERRGWIAKHRHCIGGVCTIPKRK